MGNDWEWIFRALFPQDKILKYMSQVHTNLQGHISLLQGHKVCQKHAYFNACTARSHAAIKKVYLPYNYAIISMSRLLKTHRVATKMYFISSCNVYETVLLI